jgi:long-chain acyl-CoA synthetase
MFVPNLVQDYLILGAQRHPDKTAIICNEERWTYGTLNSFSELLAKTLVALSLHRQDKVVVFLDNCSESIISLYGILKAQGVFVIVNGAIKAKKLEYILRDSGAQILITQTTKAEIVEEASKALKGNLKIIWKGPAEDIPKSLSSFSLNWDSIFMNQNKPDIYESLEVRSFSKTIDLDLAALIYTSGSTSEPKGVMSPHINMLSAARSIIEYLENTPGDVILNVLPLSFDYGLYQVIMAIMFGGTVVLERSFQYIHSILQRIPQEKVTGFPIVPTISAMMLQLRELNQYDFSSLRYMTNTAAALPVSHIQKFRKLFPEVKIFSMYGLTECKRVSYLPPDELDGRPTSVGKAMPNCEVFLLDEDGNEVEPGQTGELVIRGSNIMRGYWNSPELTAQYFRPERVKKDILLFSGDYFKQDQDGFLYFIERRDDMIKSKGERLSAKEIENVIFQMSGVKEVAVIGVPDDIFGHTVKAIISTSSGISLTENEVLKHCAHHLESFAIPKYIEFVDDLPKTPHGKIDKVSLKSSVVKKPN